MPQILITNASWKNIKDEAKNKLRPLGFSKYQLNEILNHTGPKPTADTLVELFPSLIKIYNHLQLTNIARRSGAANTLRAVLTHTPDLMKAGFSRDQIVMLASKTGGANCILAVLKYIEPLKADFSLDQIIKISSRCGAARTLETIVAQLPSLLEWGFNIEQIVKLASHNCGGARAIQLAVNYKQADESLTASEIVDKCFSAKVDEGFDFGEPNDETDIDDEMTEDATSAIPAPNKKRHSPEKKNTRPKKQIALSDPQEATQRSPTVKPKEICPVTNNIYYLPITLLPCNDTIEDEKCKESHCPHCKSVISSRVVNHGMLNSVATLLNNFPALISNQYCSPQLIHQVISDGSKDAEIIKLALAKDMAKPLASSLNIRAKQHFQAGFLQRALSDATLAITYDPCGLSYYVNRAIINLTWKQWEPALQDLSFVIQHDHTNVSAHFLRANVYESMEKPLDALVDLQEVIRLDPAKRAALQARIEKLNYTLLLIPVVQAPLEIPRERQRSTVTFFEPTVAFPLIEEPVPSVYNSSNTLAKK